LGKVFISHFRTSIGEKWSVGEQDNIKTLNGFSWFTLTSGFAFLLSQITAEIVIYTKD